MSKRALWILVAVCALAGGAGWGAFLNLHHGASETVERARIEAYERGLLNGAKATAAREAKRARGSGGSLFEQCMSHNRALRFTVRWMENRNELGW